MDEIGVDMTDAARSTSEGNASPVAQKNAEAFGLRLHNPVFFLASTLVLLFAGLTLAAPEASGAMLGSLRGHTLQTFDWLFAATPVIVFVFCFGLAISPLGRIRLGGEQAVPDYSLHHRNEHPTSDATEQALTTQDCLDRCDRSLGFRKVRANRSVRAGN